MKWTTPENISEQILKRWNRGEILAARITGEALFPLELRLRRPGPRDVTERFGDVRDWARALSGASRESRGFGYDLRREALTSRVHGTNEVPVAAIVPSETDALRLIRQQAAADRFSTLAEMTICRYPTLRAWLTRRPLTALANGDEWERVLAVIDWFLAHPRPQLYLRQLDIPGVDTKFIETRRELLGQLLDAVLPEHAVDFAASGARRFNERYGLRSEPPLVRFRILDPKLYIRGLSDLSLPPEQFGALELPVRRVFITENRTNGLAFPDCVDAMVVFGLGYGLERLASVNWLRNVEVRYWGDIDTHGFGILDRLRATLSDAQSFLMDRQTLEAHRALWGEEPLDKRYMGEPSRLTLAERALFHDLQCDTLGERVRLEQERIAYRWLEQALTDV